MDNHELADIAATLVTPGKGILAADESVGTMDKRLAAENIEVGAESRRQFRELILSTAGLEQHISGVILFDETMRQQSADGVPLHHLATMNGIFAGIKVDTGAKPLAGAPGETITEGLDGLRDRLNEYYEMGARFAKWRAVIHIGRTMPTAACVHTNAHALGRYAALCQEAGLVPIVEPEVLADGDHSLDRCGEVTSWVLQTVFDELRIQRVTLDGVVLKPNMVIPGLDSQQSATQEEVANATLDCLFSAVPVSVAGIAFLSGGQSDRAATLHLDTMNRRALGHWPLTFSFGRALLAPALTEWGGRPENVESAQSVLLHRAECNAAASEGRYDVAMEQRAPSRAGS